MAFQLTKDIFQKEEDDDLVIEYKTEKEKASTEYRAWKKADEPKRETPTEYRARKEREKKEAEERKAKREQQYKARVARREKIKAWESRASDSHNISASLDYHRSIFNRRPEKEQEKIMDLANQVEKNSQRYKKKNRGLYGLSSVGKPGSALLDANDMR